MARSALPNPEFTAEAFQLLGKPVKIDREKGIAYGIRILGPDSKNGGHYPAKVSERAKPLYEGAAVNLNHRRSLNDDVPVQDRFGRLRNVETKDSGLSGDLHFNPKHEFAEQFMWACENQPDLYGFSHLANVKWKPNADGTRTAESILKVFSVDLVADPATTSSVRESLQEPPMTLDAKATAAAITDAAALDKFLADLFAALPAGIDPAAKLAAVEKLMAGMDTATPTDTTESLAIESLKRRGGAAAWAAKIVEDDRREKAARARRDQAIALCRQEGLADKHLADVFVETVAESLGNTTRAKALIADRKANFRDDAPPPNPNPGSGNPISPPPTPPAKKSVKELVDGFTR